jgi:hypothetical protein
MAVMDLIAGPALPLKVRELYWSGTHRLRPTAVPRAVNVPWSSVMAEMRTVTVPVLLRWGMAARV